MFVEFQALYKVFGEKSYDALDLNEQEFMNDYEQFQDRIADLDRRLSAVICQGFEDCSGLESAFRVSVMYVSRSFFDSFFQLFVWCSAVRMHALVVFCCCSWLISSVAFLTDPLSRRSLILTIPASLILWTRSLTELRRSMISKWRESGLMVYLQYTRTSLRSDYRAQAKENNIICISLNHWLLPFYYLTVHSFVRRSMVV